MEVKQDIVRQFEPLLPEHAVFATNTSALPIAEIATAAKRPQNLLGMHYFSPVDKMPLLEIIPHAGTAKHVIAAAYEVGLKQGKTIIVVMDVPGFYVNRYVERIITPLFFCVCSSPQCARYDNLCLHSCLLGFMFVVAVAWVRTWRSRWRWRQRVCR